MPDSNRKIALSRCAQAWLSAHPALASELQAAGPVPAAEMRAALEGLAGEDDAGARQRLRALRRRVVLRAMARDLDGGAGLDEVVAMLSDLAEESIRAALAHAGAALAAQFGRPRDAAGREQPLVVVGMGKLGGRELNVSSDIDLVFVYPEDGETDGARALSNAEWFERAGKRLIALLADVTEDGFAFRVDMRLRPHGDAGPLALSFAALENYLVSQGREWERYAWIKGRALTGGARAEELAAIVRPFVFRKYLDYGTLAAMRQLHAEVRREVARRELAEHVKLGPGGIREIEFVAQALQLVRGGRDPALAVRPTREALARLEERRMLPAGAARELSEAYVFLRDVEHRLQYLDDRQTHELPQDEGDRERVARMAGFERWEAFKAALDAHRAVVTRHFQSVFAESRGDSPMQGAWSGDDEERRRVLAEAGFRDPGASAQRLAASQGGQRYATLPAESRRRFDALVPALVAAAQATPDPDATLARGLDLIEAIARRASYLALLAEHREALGRVATIIGASPWAAQFVTRHPILLDELLDDRVLYAPPDWPAFQAALDAQLAVHRGDMEQEMNALREQHQGQLFRLLAQDLGGRLTVESLADHLTELADRLLAAAMRLAWAQMRAPHREAPAFAVIGYGKLGGKELGYASDLDMVYVYDDADERAEETYMRYAQRLTSWLTTQTTAGPLFETDLRLRPHGDKGLLAVSLEGFRRYQESEAWVWEHQALTRARFCAGDARVGAAFEAIREAVLTRPRDAATLAAEVLSMRKRLHDGHPNRSGLFDLKHDPGGMIDVEFLVQFLVLAHAATHRRLTGNLGNLALLGLAAELGLVPAADADRVRDAYRAMRRRQHSLRLAGADYARVPPAEGEAFAAPVRALWSRVFGT